MFWDEKAECMNKEDKEKIQLERLQKTVKQHVASVKSSRTIPSHPTRDSWI